MCTSARTILLCARGGGRIRLGVAIQNPLSAKIISANFVKGQSAKILSLENLALYGIHNASTLHDRSGEFNAQGLVCEDEIGPD